MGQRRVDGLVVPSSLQSPSLFESPLPSFSELPAMVMRHTLLGDANFDGTVNISDLSNALTNCDKTASASAVGGSLAAVPEPPTLLLTAGGLLDPAVSVR